MVSWNLRRSQTMIDGDNKRQRQEKRKRRRSRTIASRWRAGERRNLGATAACRQSRPQTRSRCAFEDASWSWWDDLQIFWHTEHIWWAKALRPRCRRRRLLVTAFTVFESFAERHLQPVCSRVNKRRFLWSANKWMETRMAQCIQSLCKPHSTKKARQLVRSDWDYESRSRLWARDCSALSCAFVFQRIL